MSPRYLWSRHLRVPCIPVALGAIASVLSSVELADAGLDSLRHPILPDPATVANPASITSIVAERVPFEINDVSAMVSSYGHLTNISFPLSWSPWRGVYYAGSEWPLGLTIGCIRTPDTLTTNTAFMYPASNMYSFEPLVVRYGNPKFEPFDPRTPADFEVASVLSDSANYGNIDEATGMQMSPIGIELHQSTMGWQHSYLRRTIFVSNWIVNISDLPIERASIGIRIIGEAFSMTLAERMCHAPTGTYCGIIRTVPGIAQGIDDTINLAWVANTNGQPGCTGGKYGPYNPTAVMGVRVIQAPRDAQFSFNWWSCGWGPRQRASMVRYPKESAGPLSDRSLYNLMTNGEVDYDQVMAALDLSAEGWVPPQGDSTPNWVTEGCRPELMLSVGPLAEPILPDDSIAFTYAIIMGADFHTDPNHYARTFDPMNPAPYLNGLDFSSLISGAQWASWFYDNPGVDSDGDGYAGEFHQIDCPTANCDSIYYTGDGVPDLVGALPPPPPDDLTFTTYPTTIVARWSGRVTEFARDRHARRPDFEGYKVYIAENDTSTGWTLIGSWDREDFTRYSFHNVKQTWIKNSPPHTTTEWRQILSNPGFDPLDHTMPSFTTAYHDSATDTVLTPGGAIVDISTRDRWSYFAPEAYNQGNSSGGGPGMTPNPLQLVQIIDTVIDGRVEQYGVYEYQLANLSQSKPYWLTVTAFDYGDYRSSIDPEESRPGENAQRFLAVNSVEVVIDSNLKVNVYPNPYKSEFIDSHGNVATYNSQGFEYSPSGKFDERDRRIWFANVPDTATIEIYSLDGDLIRRIYHPDTHLTKYESVVGWDLISRNTQAVVSGIYIWRVTSRLGEQIGKLVIIK